METTGSKLTNMPDTDLVRLAIEQNQAAFIVLYTRYNTGVKSHIARYVIQKEDVEEGDRKLSPVLFYKRVEKQKDLCYNTVNNSAGDMEDNDGSCKYIKNPESKASG